MKNVPIFFNNGALVVTVKEMEFLEQYIKTGGDLEDSCKVSGLDIKVAKEFMNGPRIGAYIMTKLDQYSRKNNITLESVLDKLHKVAFEGVKADKMEMKALELLAHYLGILKPQQVNVGVNVNNNPLETKSDDELESMIKQRLTSELK